MANNVQSTFHVLTAIAEQARSAHLVHIGTMGVYGYDAEDYALPEGYLRARVTLGDGNTKEIEFLHPMKPGSVYHLTKAQDQLLFEFFNRQQNLRITDLHQGIVWGTDTELTRIDHRLATRFDYDSDFGTVLNRFAAQTAIGHPLTVYGSGTQMRAFIHLRDSIQCLLLAIGNPPKQGEKVRIFNQFTQMFSVIDIANLVAHVGAGNIGPIENPRIEKEGNRLSALNAELRNLGLRPTMLNTELVREIITIATRHKGRVNADVIRPLSFWRRSQAA
jgi:UDP-sulfoquinovose synthase